MFFGQFTNPARTFQYDYIYIDAIFLIVWLVILLWNKKYKALLFGVAISPIIYIIDAHIWWNTSIGGGMFMREYWIGGVPMPHPLGEYLWLKFRADFMMTISYALYTFPWIWIMFENVKNANRKEILKYTSLFFVFWLIVPLLSFLIPLDDTIVEAARHMDSQLIFWIINVIIGYALLFILYKNTPLIPAKVFAIGAMGALIMEVPLFVFGIRPTGISFVLFETVFLLNQGVPYLYLVWDKILKKPEREIVSAK